MKYFNAVWSRLVRLSLAAGILFLAEPVFAQYYANDITPPSSNTGKLNGAANGKQVGGSGNGHAVLLNGNALSSADLHPAAYSTSIATSTDDVQQCGYGYAPLGGGNHALMWSGSAASYVDLHNIFTWTYCTGVQGGQQVGFGERPVYTVFYQHAMLWNGSAATAVDLHPVGYSYSKAMGVAYGQQVGYASTTHYPIGDTIGYQPGSHALLWTGTAASVVDLHPAGYDASQALATNGVQQGGWGYIALSSTEHAMMWSGTAASFMDLHPAGFNDSRMTALTPDKQVGDGWIGPMGQPGSVRHALVWSGTADSVVDLNQYLPAGYTHAVATGVDPNGNVVGYAYNTFVQGLEIPPDAIAVVFAPGQGSPTALSSISLGSANVAPGAVVQGSVSIPTAAPASGVSISFFSTNAAVLPAPATLTIPAGQTSAAFSIQTGGAALQTPTTVKIYASDGTVSKSAPLTITPIVNLSSVTLNSVEGGFSTTGTIALSIPAQAGGAAVTLTSGNPALAAVPASVTLPLGTTSMSFTVTTSSVGAATTVPVTAVFNGQTINTSVALSPAPVVAVSSLTFSFPSVVGGQSATATVTVSNFPRDPNGAAIALSSGDAKTLQVPATITIPYGTFSATFPVTTIAVNGTKGVAVKASYNASSITATIQVVPIPTVTIVQADYYTDTQLLKVAATTTFANSVLTYGTDPNLPSIGTMQFELGQYKGASFLATAPAFATVWNSNGGQATIAVTKRLSTVTGGGAAGGGGGGGGATAAGSKIIVSRSSKGSVVSNPAGIACGSNGNACSVSFASGATVTLTATPDPGITFIGWTGACTGASPTCTLTMTADKSVTPSFR
jgi:hypothetical protein